MVNYCELCNERVSNNNKFGICKACESGERCDNCGHTKYSHFEKDIMGSNCRVCKCKKYVKLKSSEKRRSRKSK